MSYMRQKRMADFARASKYSKKPRTGGYRRQRPFVARNAAPRRVLQGRLGETKCIDVVNANNGAAIVATSLSTVPAIFPLNIVTIGSSAWNRIGRKITLKSLYLTGFFTGTGALVQSAGHFGRIMIIYDKQTNGAQPVIQDILTDQINQTGGDVKTQGVMSNLNMNNRDRFEVILDKRFWLPGSNAAGTVTGLNGGTTAATVEEYRNLRNRETQFKADSVPGVIGDINNGSLLMVSFGDLPGGTAPWQFLFTCRIKYKDI